MTLNRKTDLVAKRMNRYEDEDEIRERRLQHDGGGSLQRGWQSVEDPPSRRPWSLQHTRWGRGAFGGHI